MRRLRSERAPQHAKPTREAAAPVVAPPSPLATAHRAVGNRGIANILRQSRNDNLELEADTRASQLVAPSAGARGIRSLAQADGFRAMGGNPLDLRTRSFFESRLGVDLGQVRVHTDTNAARLAGHLDAAAFTYGADIAFAAGRYAPGSPKGDRLLAHELAHVIQQEGRAPAVQRYEAGEHASMGDTQPLLEESYGPIKYTVVADDTPRSIADKLGVTVAELESSNRSKLRRWPATRGSGTVLGFEVGEQLIVPRPMNPMAQALMQDRAVKIKVTCSDGELVVDYQVLIAMGGDMFATPDDIGGVTVAELK